jgi:cysteine synthase
MEKVLEVKGEDAVKMARELAVKEGRLVSERQNNKQRFF